MVVASYQLRDITERTHYADGTDVTDGPDGIYRYFATVDENWDSAYPYSIGYTYYGEVETDNFGGGATIDEDTPVYNPSASVVDFTLSAG